MTSRNRVKELLREAHDELVKTSRELVKGEIDTTPYKGNFTIRDTERSLELLEVYLRLRRVFDLDVLEKFRVALDKFSKTTETHTAFTGVMFDKEYQDKRTMLLDFKYVNSLRE